MQLKRIQYYLDHFKSFLESDQKNDRLYIWESQRIFQEEWNLDADDLELMYDLSLENKQTRRLWSRESYDPKRVMLLFWGYQADFVRQMFQDLFNEEKAIDGRVDRFVFHCDQMLQSYQEEHNIAKENSHFHNDNYEMISLYLAFRYPTQYTLYRKEGFHSLLRKLGVTNIPQTHDIERFFKVMRTLFNFMKKDDNLIQLHQKRLDPAIHYMEDSLLLSFDFYQYCTQFKYKVPDYPTN